MDQQNAERLTTESAGMMIRERFGALAGLPVTHLGAGTDHIAFDVGGRFVFRFPRHSEVAATLATEARLTAWLAPQLPLAIPEYRYFGGTDADGSVRFAGYARLPGTPALLAGSGPSDAAAAGRRLGEFLLALHGCDAASAAALGVPPDDDPARDEWSAAAVADVQFAADRGHLDAGRAAEWERYLSVPPLPDPAQVCVIHGDFAAEHVLLADDGMPLSVIDWSDAVLGDPARDLAGLFHWGDAALLQSALRHYDAAGAMLERAYWFAACRAVADIGFGDTEQRPEYTAAGLCALTFLEAP